MKRLLEDWELDMLADGAGTPEMQRTLASSVADQQQLQRLQRDEQALRRALFRADCPSALTLGEWHFGMVAEAVAQRIQSHLAGCTHCTAELKQMQAAMDAPVQVEGERTPLLRRIILKLENMMDDIAGPTGATAPALRGDLWSGLYASGDYMISLTKRRGKGGFVLQGSVDMPEPTSVGQAQLTLKQNDSVIVTSPLSTVATFSFDHLQPGRYELIVTTASSELVVPELQF
jgi:hypothetical protein